MKIVFSAHAELKIRERNIDRTKVLKALQDPEYLFPSYANRQVVYRKFGKLYLKVIFRKENDILTIITQHWDEMFQPPIV